MKPTASSQAMLNNKSEPVCCIGVPSYKTGMSNCHKSPGLVPRTCPCPSACTCKLICATLRQEVWQSLLQLKPAHMYMPRSIPGQTASSLGMSDRVSGQGLGPVCSLPKCRPLQNLDPGPTYLNQVSVTPTALTCRTDCHVQSQYTLLQDIPGCTHH